ncbi:hypothetical protein BD311DRAFT_762984 [Dichomitus squalens]|uniref:Uncharacterized protein n=1 Tax=Dichomitus squalens TaxID=114155 RepID=A0A4V2JZU7_9APHY|nr:hypothetical protein BD311DRAFT_762984 [Dichomitus squalens]
MSSNKLRKPRHESRTMALARQMVGSADNNNRITSHGGIASWDEHLIEVRSTTALSHKSPVGYRGRMRSADSPPQTSIQDYLSALLHPVSAIEQYWAMRAERAEALLNAHERYKRELDDVSVSHEQRRSRELAELNARYARECAHVTRMVWICLGALTITVCVLFYVVFRYAPRVPSDPSRSSAVHYTIPILSPFSSVIEHETSAVNVPLVAVLLIIMGLFGFLWFRCCALRR